MQDFIPPLNLSDLDDYYQAEFTKIHDSNETYKGKWNWWAFFFTTIWCLLKGCWLVAILTILTVSFSVYKHPIADGVFLNIGISTGIIWSLVLGWRGTWLYYNVRTYKKQLPRF